MDWNSRVLDAAALNGEGRSFPDLLEALFEQQLRDWSQLREGVEALQSVEVRQLFINGVSVSLQHNPRRIVSTSASVDEASIRERPCFLCAQNMPAEEKGLAFGDGLIAFCNPFPVLERHLVVLAREHIPQQLGGHIEQFLDLAASLGRDYVALYNGAKCGASAPDHLHFQAGRAGRLPIFDDIARKRSAGKTHGLYTSDSYGARFIWFRTGDHDQALMTIESLMEILNRNSIEVEAMVNLLARHDGVEWEIVIIPRAKHRPAAYFEAGDARILVSPAAIDLAGMVVVPRKTDFDGLDENQVRGIFSEVTLPEVELAVAVERVADRRQIEVRS